MGTARGGAVRPAPQNRGKVKTARQADLPWTGAWLAGEVTLRLRRELGLPVPPPKRPPLDELVNAILSQNTNDRNRDRAFNALKSRFPSWKCVLAATEGELADVIRPAGLAPTKAKRIRELLFELQAREDDLAGICRLPRDEALARLTAIKGVGPKTAACVLLFSCGAPAFPVDTHIFRVAGRLGLLPPGTDRVKAHKVLAGLFRPRDYLEAHLNLIGLGRTACRPSKPLCMECPLADICKTGRTAL